MAEIWSFHISSDFLPVPVKVNPRSSKSSGANNTHTLQGWYFCRLGFFTEFVRSNRNKLRSMKREHSHRLQTCMPPLLRGTTSRMVVVVNKLNSTSSTLCPETKFLLQKFQLSVEWGAWPLPLPVLCLSSMSLKSTWSPAASCASAVQVAAERAKCGQQRKASIVSWIKVKQSWPVLSTTDSQCGVWEKKPGRTVVSRVT